nr:MAG: replication associated protein [Cressdnaviricota sp.]
MAIWDVSCVYLVFAFEIGTEGTRHMQGYVYYKDQRTLSAVSKDFPRAHLIVSNGSAEENRIYIIGPYDKDGKHKPYNPEHCEFGRMPQQGKITWDRIEEVMQDPQENPHLYNQYRKMYKEFTLNKPKDDNPRQLYLTPDDTAFDLLKEFEEDGARFQTCFDIDVYNGEDNLVLSEPYSNQPFLKQWCRGYPFRIKRGYELICVDPKCIICEYTDPEELGWFKKNFGEFITNIFPEEIIDI